MKKISIDFYVYGVGFRRATFEINRARMEKEIPDSEERTKWIENFLAKKCGGTKAMLITFKWL